MNGQAAVTRTTELDTDAVEAEFIERMGMVLQAEGMPRTAGRLMGFFVLHGGPVSFGDLSERLQISRASVSNNTRLLESLGVIERTGRPGDRQDYFRLADAPYRRLLERAVERMAHARAAVERAERELPVGWQGARERLAQLSAFYATAEDGTKNLLDALAGQD